MPVSLHTHSWYSLLEGASSPEQLLQRAAACGANALALTDTNNLYGAPVFVELAHRQGIRPLLGACLRQNRTRCVALIAELAGYRNLCRVLSRLHLGEPPPHLADLLTAHPAGLHLLVDDPALADRVRAAFPQRLWLELVRPPRTAAHERELIEFGQRHGLPFAASTAVHAATPEDYPTFRLITAVRQTTLLDQLPARFTVTPEHHLLELDKLWHRFRDLPEAVRNTDALAEQLSADVLPHEVVLPPPRVPRNLDALRFLELLCDRGLRRRQLVEDPTAQARLREELTLIAARNLTGYFLTVRGIAHYARGKRHSMALRGSAGNSLVCYLLEITEVNPLRFNLPLERFLHPGRVDLPDIDLDFDWKVRDDVIAHVFRRYGAEHTAMISSHLFLQPRSAFRESAKIHGLSNAQIGRVLETWSDRGTHDCRGVPPPQGFPLEPERWDRILDHAQRLLGRPHHLSIHPGGVVITPGPIEDYVPLQRAPKGITITQLDKDGVEAIGLVKFDLLGNRALATVDEAVAYLPCSLDALSPGSARLPTEGSSRQAQASASGGTAKSRGLRPQAKPGDEELDRDPATLALLRRGDTLGVNQLESPAMRHLLVQMQPRGLEDVIEALALIRPGAASIGAKELFVRRRRGLDPVRVPHPCLESVLRDTEGLMLYEDDALSVIRALTGLPVPEADRLRKRVTKHRTEAEARALSEEFLAACTRNGIPQAVAADFWVQLAKFNQYSFCKSHAVSYGLIAWKAVRLKAHYPHAFWVAALNNNQGMYPRRVYIEAVKRAGIPLRLPCINRSADGFTLEGNAVRIGLSAIASLDEETRAHLLTERQRGGRFRDLADFRRRVRPGPDALNLLIRCGALDGTGLTRPALFLEADLQGQADQLGPRLFTDDPDQGGRPADYAGDRRMRDEWNLLGFVAGPALLTLFRPRLPPDLVRSRDLHRHVGRVVRLAGVVATARHTETVHGQTMQFVTLEDEDGLSEVTLFPGICPPVAYLHLGPYLVTGLVEEQYGVVTIRAYTFRLAEGNPTAHFAALPFADGGAERAAGLVPAVRPPAKPVR